MERLSTTARAIAKKLREYPGGLTSKDLKQTYVEIYPLIERKLVTVTSVFGVPIYVLTEQGIAWVDGVPDPQKSARQTA